MMDSHDAVSLLEDRITRLESANRRSRLVAMLLGAFLGLAVLTGQSPNGPTIIGDPQGAHLALSSSGIMLYGTNPAQAVVNIRAYDYGGAVRIYDAAGKERAYTGVFSDNGSGFEALDKGATYRSFSGVQPDGASGLYLYDARGKQRIGATISTSNAMAIYEETADGLDEVRLVSDETGGFLRIGDGATKNSRAYIGLYSNGSSGVTIYDKAGKSTWSSTGQ